MTLLVGGFQERAVALLLEPRDPVFPSMSSFDITTTPLTIPSTSSSGGRQDRSSATRRGSLFALCVVRKHRMGITCGRTIQQLLPMLLQHK
jgi:hypothetical protein